MTFVVVGGNGGGGVPRWEPKQGREAARIAEKLPSEGRDTILSEASAILSRCVPPGTAAGRDVGLVVGYVQSGKTLSFTTLCALARDNHYPLIIVITGTATNLMRQSDKRLVKDLIDGRDDRQWQHIPFDTQSASPVQLIQAALHDWRDPQMPPSLRRTTLVTVLKNHANLRRLRRELQTDSLQSMLSGAATLIIDDEADQASLNSRVRQNAESSTYARIQEFRASLPCHTYVQYTATPQAPVLINIIGALSPSWVEVLTPGADYTGGRTFFSHQRPRPYIRIIPPTEVYDPNSNLLDSPPATFKSALATFFLGVSVARENVTISGNRSMLVHPHQNVNRHEKYFQWATALKDSWLRLFSPGGDTEPDYAETMALFEAAHAELALTCPAGGLPSFELLRGHPMQWAIRSTNVQEVNASRGRTPDVPFKDVYSHVLVGGQSMDRGFTVEGLTVTYMPRGIGVGNADTIQQRARFFGYKRSYLGFCRVWLEQATLDAMDSYVEHEESMRQQLIEHRDTNKSLKDWPRAFFLSPLFEPTRRQVLSGRPSGDFSRGGSGRGPADPHEWIFPDCPHLPTDPVDCNEKAIAALLQELQLAPDEGDPRRTDMQIHRVAHGVPIQRLYDFLLDLKYVDTQDSEEHTGALLQLKSWKDQPGAPQVGHVYEMASGKTRERTLNDDDEIGPLMQGENAATGYPGDRRIGREHELTIQIHRVLIKPNADPNLSTIDKPVEMSVVAIGLPREARRAWLTQVQR
jgi:hypothetical protein